MTADKNRAEQIILEILRQAGDKGLGKTKLYKAFWLAHLFYAKDNPGYLSGWPVVRMPQGPGIDKGDALIRDLVASREITVSLEPRGPFSERCCRFVGVTQRPPLGAPGVEAVRQAVEYVKGLTAAEISEISHDYSRSWRTTPDGQELDIYTDLIPDEEYAERQCDMNHAKVALESLFL
jgi:predicted transcriptional regulator